MLSSRGCLVAVAKFGGDIDIPTVADVHLLHEQRKTIDVFSHSARQGHVATAAVELLAIDGLARVTGGN